MGHFSKEEIEEIRSRLATKTVKDSQFPTAKVIKLEDFVAIVQDAVNKKISVEDLYSGIAGNILENYIFLVEVICENGAMLLHNGGEADMRAIVKLGYRDITDSVPPNYFSWERSSGNQGQDALWTAAHAGVGPVVHVTSADVNGACTFYCLIPIDALKQINI